MNDDGDDEPCEHDWHLYTDSDDEPVRLICYRCDGVYDCVVTYAALKDAPGTVVKVEATTPVYDSREPNVSQVLSGPSNKGPSQIRNEGEIAG